MRRSRSSVVALSSPSPRSLAKVVRAAAHGCPAKRFLMLALVVLALACTGTETDNPLDPDLFESPVDLNPPPDPVPPCMQPEPNSRPADLARFQVTDTHLIGLRADRELAWFTDRLPEAPEKVASVASANIRQVLAHAGSGAFVVADVRTPFESTTAPELSALGPVTRVMYWSLDPAGEPQERAARDVEGEFWQLVEHAGLYWVMSARPQADTDGCPAHYPCGGAPLEALVLEALRPSEAGFEPVQRVELPMDADAWATPEGFASFERGVSGAGGRLHLVRFDADGRLGAPEAIDLDATPLAGSPISLAGDLVRMAVRSPSTGDVALAYHDLRGTGGTRLASIPLPGPAHASGLRFAAQASYVAGLRIDERDPAQPIATALPADDMLVVPVSESADGTSARLLGMSQASGGLEFVLLAVIDGEVQPVTSLDLPDTDQADLVSTELSALAARVVVHAPYALFSYLAEPSRTWRMRVLRIEGDSLAWQTAPTEAGTPLLSGQRLFVVAQDGIVATDLTTGETAKLGWTEVGTRSATLSIGDRRATLVYTATGLSLRLESEDMPGQAEYLPVSPLASELIVARERLLVLSTEPLSQCLQSGYDCTDYAPSVEVFDLTPPAHRVARVALPMPFASGAEGDRVDAYWWQPRHGQWPVLPDGRAVFALEWQASCTQPDECEALDIPYLPIAQSDVRPNPVTGCTASPPGEPQLPCEPPPAPTVYGERRERRVFVLDPADDDPHFGTPGYAPLAHPSARFGDLLVSEGLIWSTRLEPAPGAEGLERAHFIVDRFAVDQDSHLTALPPLRVPGYPVAATNGGATLFTVEPMGAPDYGVTVYRLSVEADRPTVRASVAQPGEYDDFGVGPAAVMVRHGEAGCDGQTQLVPLDLDTLAPGEPVRLPGAGYHIAGWDGTAVQLGSPLALAVSIELADGMHPGPPQFRFPALP